MRFTRIFLSLAIFFIAFLAGIRAGEKFNLFEDLFVSQMDDIAKPALPIPENNQFNLLVIGADDSGKKDAQLESVWLVAHADKSPKVSLVPIFPSPENPIQNLVLANAFELKNGKPGKDFWDAMRDTNFWWNAYIITDMAETINMVDRMGGVQINDRVINGTQAVHSIPPWENDPLTAVKYQKIILEGICKQIAKDQTANLKTASELVLMNFRSIVSASTTFTVLTAQSELRGKLACRFPTLE